jgi:hypothetical protein
MPGENQTPPLSAHDQAMVAKVDQVDAAAKAQQGIQQPQAPAEAAKPQRPEGVPEKFWDAEKGVVNTDALLKSYTELESAKGKAPAETPKEGEKTPEEAAKALADAKVDVQSMSTEYAEKGQLSEQSYAKLAEAGFPKEVVDSYIAGQEALAAQRGQEGFKLAGGEDQFKAMATWAVQALPQAEIDAFNASMDGSPAQMKQAILGLKAQFEAANGKDPQLVQGNSGGNSPTGAFASRAEVTAAMRDPRYKADPAYRADVERRVGLMDNF